MTAEELSNMTDEEKRIAIAKACGWAEIHIGSGFGGEALRGYPWFDGIGMGEDTEEIPDYLNDLDACREFEETIAGVDAVLKRREYVKNLMAIVEVDPDMSRWSFIQDFILLHATSARRCDAFLLTIQQPETK